MTTPLTADRPAGVTAADKMRFLAWAQDTHQMDGGQFKVLFAVVECFLGLQSGRPHNGWFKMAVLAMRCQMSMSAVRRALDRLEALGLLKVTSQAGREGRVYVHVPGVVGAVQNLKLRSLRKPIEPDGHDEDGEGPSQTSRQREDKKSPNLASTRRQTSRQREVNPLLNPLQGSNHLNGAPGGAASRASGLNFGGGGKGAFGPEDEADALTRPRGRLLKRLEGLCKKADLPDDGFALQAVLSEDPDEKTVRYWLKLQRQKKDDRLFRHMSQAIADHYRLNPAEVGRKLAARAEPEPQPAPRPVLRTMVSAIREPVLRLPPRPAYACSAEAMRASAANLGIPLKGAAS